MTAPIDRDDQPCDAFRLFRKLVPPDFLDEFDVGHAGVFSSWIVVWLMTFQRIHANAPLSRAVARCRRVESRRRLAMPAGLQAGPRGRDLVQHRRLLAGPLAFARGGRLARRRFPVRGPDP